MAQLTRLKLPIATLASLILLAWLSGCTSNSRSDDPPASTNLKSAEIGYEGEVRPFSIPVQLRYREVPSFQSHVTAKVSVQGGSTEKIRVTIRGSILPLGDKLVLTMHMEGNTARLLMDSLGNVSEVEYTDPGESEFNFESVVSRVTQAFKIEPIAMGDEVFESKNSTEFMKEIIGYLDSEISVQDSIGGVSNIAEGLTIVGGRDGLFVKSAMDFTVRGSELFASVLAGGYTIYDVQAGWPLKSSILMTLLGRDEKRTVSMTVRLNMDTVFK